MIQPHIVFIDDGVDNERFSFLMRYDLQISSDYTKFEKRHSSYKYTEFSHGTICAAIVKKYYKNFICSSLKILNSNKKCNIQALSTAIDWCIKRKIDIVNVSLGSIDFHDEDILRHRINRLAQHSVIVSAISNKLLVTYPGSFSNVIGVARLESHESNIVHCGARIDGVDIMARAVHSLETNDGHVFSSDDANSFAGPYVVAEICNMYFRESKNKLYTHFREIKDVILNTLLHNKYYNSSLLPDWISSAFIFSSADIIHDMVYFTVKASFLINNFDTSKTPEAFKNEIDNVDTLIFIFDEIASNLDKQRFVHFGLQLKKHIVVIGAYGKGRTEFNAFNKKMWHSMYWKPNLYHYSNNSIQIQETPIIVIYDSSLKRLILSCKKIQKKFKENGYNMKVITNSPIGVLNNFFFIPFLELDSIEYVSQVQNIARADIIICGVLTEQINMKEYADHFSNIGVDVDISLTYSSEGTLACSEDMLNIRLNENPLKINMNSEHIIEKCALQYEHVAQILIERLERG